ncbi:MAG: DUF86 domain-containing protein [Candidatus Aenigmarchaeota archaeon]|nr:DUF86 domain-containing protein [Candidatus Aenigmarchaeota archaeon]
MLDEERILSKIDEINSYLEEMKDFIPKSFEDYMNSSENRRVCERLLQISIECVIDICSLMVKGLKLGAPSDEDDLFQKLKRKKIVSSKTLGLLKGMKGFRNILVHRYAEVDDELVFQFLKSNLGDFSAFKKEILNSLK